MSARKTGSCPKTRYKKASLALAAQLLLAGGVQAGVGFVNGSDLLEQPIVVPTFFAHSPSGLRQPTTMGPGGTLDAAGKAGAEVDRLFTGYRQMPDTGKALRKFVDPLAPLGPFATSASTLGSNPAASKQIPLARPEKWTSPNGVTTGDDYLEIAAVEYREQMHSDLPAVSGGVTGVGTGGTLLRGYVQIVTPAMESAAGASTLTPGMTEMVRTAALTAAGYKQLFYPDGSPIQIWDTHADGSRNGLKKSAWAVTDPHYLGPAILALRGTPMRVKFWNLLPVGRAVVDTVPMADGQANVLARNGDLFIPVDKSLMGAGLGPDNMSPYSQNRIAIHLHGGDNPWISDGTAHQWFVPIGEEDEAHTTATGFSGNSLASEINPMDPAMLPNFLRGASARNVPDMFDPGPGAMTLYYPNGQSARLMWYHDHAVGTTRLNAYAGMAAPYWLTDEQELRLMPAQSLPGILASTPGNPGGALDNSAVATGVIPGLADTIPLVLQDKCFVPKDVALQDARWNTTAWGGYGNLYFPHVYETVQDPAQANNWNVVGRWHYGPWFWPVFPALYPLPTGGYGDETTTPEAWCDTPVINGVAYPFIEVDPKPYRLRLLNGANDRFFTFNLFMADPNGAVIDASGNVGSPPNAAGVRTWVDAAGNVIPGPVGGTFWPTDVKMVAASTPSNPCPGGVTRSDQVPGGCTPAEWPTDGRPGGVPDPATAGPTMYQIGNEGGLLARVATIDPLPMNPQYDVGRITVMNILTTGLYLGNAERADVVVDFSNYAGQTLVAYNDMNAPVPAGDPRNAYFTGVGDQSGTGGAEDTVPGYGPNTRTLMQFRVRQSAQSAGIALDVAKLQSEIPKAYAASQERPVVAQSAYNQAFSETWNDAKAFATIYTGSLKQPQFQFVPGNPGMFDAIRIDQPGSGYITAPVVTFVESGTPTATALASARATLKMDRITVLNAGSGYTVAPAVSIATTTGGGTGATARTTLKVTGVKIANAGSGYTAAPLVTFSKPQEPGGVTATGTAVIGTTGTTKGKVTQIVITNPGSGYLAAPTVAIAPPLAGVKALATSSGSVDRFVLTSPDPTNPGAAGGGGYTDFNGVTITLTAAPAGGVTATGSATGKVFDITLVHPGTGYSVVPSVSLSGGGGTGALASAAATGQASYLVKTKAIQELFEPTFGRLNATLGIEIPFTSALTQTTIPLFYIDPPSEVINDFETQIWKITHNGVDTHPVHFHLMNVQVVNRVGWDGFITPPEPGETGWKETVRMNPLEDIIVALKPKRPVLPGFGLPMSIRPMDPSQPLGSPFGFTQIDVNTGLPAQVVNAMTNFGWEYVWHCHILGHEENDFMRPVVFQVTEAVPGAPGALVGVASPAGVQLNWVDNASTEYQQTLQIVSGATTTLTDLPANLTQYLDPTPLAADTLRSYTVTATGAAGSTKSATFSLAVPNPPGLSAIAQKAGTATMTLTFVDNSKIEKSWVVQQSLDGGVSWSDVAAVASTTGSTVGTRTITVTATSGGSVQYRIAANASTTNVPSTSSAWSAAKAVTIAKVNQTLTFPASLTLGTNATVTSSSALPVTLTTTTPAICTVQGNVITPVAVGTCTITGDQLGSTLWNAATTTTRSLAVSQKTQTITFAPATTLTRPATLTLAATATSGLPVTLTTTTPRICTIAGTVLSGVAAGTCTVTASQLGDATWKAATAVTRSVRIR